MALDGNYLSCDRCHVGYKAGEHRPTDFVITRTACLCVRCAPKKRGR